MEITLYEKLRIAKFFKRKAEPPKASEIFEFLSKNFNIFIYFFKTFGGVLKNFGGVWGGFGGGVDKSLLSTHFPNVYNISKEC